MLVDAKIKLVGAIFTGRSGQIVRDNQLACMHEATQYVTRRVKERTPQGVMGAQGGLLGSIQPEVRQTGARVAGLVGTANPYALVVEMGRRPGKAMPPAGTLVGWIRVKMGVTRAEAERIEFPLRRSIGKKGFDGALMFADTLDEDWPMIRSIFDRYGVELSRRLDR